MYIVSVLVKLIMLLVVMLYYRNVSISANKECIIMSKHEITCSVIS